MKNLYLVGTREGVAASALGPYEDGAVRALLLGRRELQERGAEAVYRTRANNPGEAIRNVTNELKNWGK